ncbi:succinylglutamate desuccinylase/aspartoacylase family protein [Flavilitoribacter nigricans]|uniref:Succinylglutamate desuccinylase n=1 Tax=Flavilitoribacter nigricans (strain ATCC 23147 / DSM 23189 / NBRC 102662 / NCIMB 1420 / SS-2) TaxID=1122177 RepID=A0A2D0N3J9_FLAN2|nr:succinylglutamate desuccinylase/aspartoacylase family protein [Flavilitoribacter nigricans]PHN02968.1 succinylglutamate desuccinylase [Flavilitoribacter nigricans DSM 23189 = NBRC 102662]
MNINGIDIAPGEQNSIKISVGQLPSGTRISIHAHIYRSAEPGPTMLVLGGVHGDEINGVEIIRRAVDDGLFEQLTKGNVIAIPLLNIYGFINFSRDVPDGKDVNRSFPGSTSGSLASRVARTITKKILPLVDFGIDFHTGGRSLYNYPQVRFTRNHAESEQLAMDFGAPFALGMGTIAKSLRRTALDLEKPIIVFEGGESLRYDSMAIQKGLSGLHRVLARREMIKSEAKAANTEVFKKTTWIRAEKAGMFLWIKCSGNKVEKGDVIGQINGPYGKSNTIWVKAKESGIIIGHNNAPVVSQGDALFHIAYE